jgi:CheY-like chemotaxis protein/HPt (histidine-containing phosphotransfer) domain-containing protein
MTQIDFQEALAQLRQEFIDSSSERLDKVDVLIDRMYRQEGDGNADFVEFQRDIHSMKGSAGTYGFDSVTLIAHKLEDFIESASDLNNGQLLDIQVYVDRIRDILESGENASQDRLNEILVTLPSNGTASAITQERRTVSVFLVMPKGVQRKVITQELVSCGFNLAFANRPLEAFSLAVSLKPDLIVSSMEFSELSGLELAWSLRAVKAIRDTPIVILTSHETGKLACEKVPSDTQVIHKGPEFAADLANLLMQKGMIG